MSRGHEIGGKYREDPVGSEAPRGKNREQRKHRNDGPSWTPTEQHIKNNLMRQFMRTGEGPGAPSRAFRDNYDRTFGRHAGATVDAAKCDSLTCWCQSEWASE